jgi:ammonia channel protein AmtB
MIDTGDTAFVLAAAGLVLLIRERLELARQGQQH